MALMDSGLPMCCLFCGITCAIDADGEIITDPTAAQEKANLRLICSIKNITLRNCDLMMVLFV